MLRNTFQWFMLGLLVMLSVSCKSKYEQVRASGNPDVILKSAFEYYEKKQYARAKPLFELVMNNLRGRADAEKAYFAFADSHYQTDDFVLASYYFKNYASTYTQSPRREEAAFLSAYCHYLMSPSYRLEQSETMKAIDEMQNFTNNYPESKNVTKCNSLIDELRRKMEKKAFAEGELYFNLKQYQSAMASFDNLLKDFPESPDVERVRYLVAKSAYLLADNSVLEKRKERYGDALSKCELYLAKYPKNQYTKEMKEIRRTCESRLKQFT